MWESHAFLRKLNYFRAVAHIAEPFIVLEKVNIEEGKDINFINIDDLELDVSLNTLTLKKDEWSKIVDKYFDINDYFRYSSGKETYFYTIALTEHTSKKADNNKKKWTKSPSKDVWENYGIFVEVTNKLNDNSKDPKKETPVSIITHVTHRDDATPKKLFN